MKNLIFIESLSKTAVVKMSLQGVSIQLCLVQQTSVSHLQIYEDSWIAWIIDD